MNPIMYGESAIQSPRPSQRTITCSAPLDTTLQALLLQARLDLERAVGAVRPDLLAGVGEVENIVQLLTVVHGRVRRIPFADQLVRLVHADMVLVAVEALVVPLRPARVLVLLGILGRLLLPSLRRLAGLDRLVLLLRVALLGHRHNRGVNDLAAARNIASIFYLGINVGAFAAPLICGTLAVQYGWHYGFAAAGVGMLISLAIYLCGTRTLPADVPARSGPI